MVIVMANEFLIYAYGGLGIVAPVVATLGVLMLFFDPAFPRRDYEPRPIAKKLQLIGFLLIFVPACLSLLLRMAIA
jgi:hypothetical protein